MNVIRRRHHAGPGPAAPMHRLCYGRSCGTFGELLQGVLPGGDGDSLVTLPISEFSTARFTPTPAAEPLVVSPASEEKTRRPLFTMTAAYGYHGGGVLELTSALAEGKGLLASPPTDREKQEYAGLLAALSAAVRTHDLGTVGAVATRSALRSAKVRARPYLGALLRISREADALDPVLAHSGTVLGVLIVEHDPGREAKLRQVTAARRLLAGSVSVYTSWCPTTSSCPAPAGPRCGATTS